MNHSKSGLFLMELLINLLMFCLLCGCSLTFFLHSQNFIKNAAALHQAVSISSSIASLYESGNGSFDLCNETYPQSEFVDNVWYLYLDKTYQACEKEDSAYVLQAEYIQTIPIKKEINMVTSQEDNNCIQLNFYERKDMLENENIYSIKVCCHVPRTLGDLKEETKP